jgi:hypothetical protein
MSPTSPFQSVARVAIEQLLEKHTQPSKFGFFLTQEGFDTLALELLTLLETSRTLRATGDRFLQGPAAPLPSATKSPRPMR